MNIEIIKLNTLASEPTLIDKYSIKPKTLKDIVKVGYEKYNQYLTLFCMSDDMYNKFKDSIKSVNENYECSYLEYLTFLYLEADTAKNSFKEDIVNSLRFFIGEDFYFNPTGFFYHNTTIQIPEIINGETAMVEKPYMYILNDKVFDDIRQIVKIQNCLLDDEVENISENPANSHVAALLEKRKKAREKLKKAKKNSGEDDEGLSLYDLTSIVASNCNGINILNVWDLNFIQFNDQLNRMKMLEEYSVNIQALLSGADSKNINLVHWMSKIKKQDED